MVTLFTKVSTSKLLISTGKVDQLISEIGITGKHLAEMTLELRSADYHIADWVIDNLWVKVVIGSSTILFSIIWKEEHALFPSTKHALNDYILLIKLVLPPHIALNTNDNITIAAIGTRIRQISR